MLPAAICSPLAGLVTEVKEIKQHVKMAKVTKAIIKPLDQYSAYSRARDTVTLFKSVKTQNVGKQS